MKKQFILDTSFLVNGWRKHYRIDVFPTIWERIDDLMQDATVISCEEVFNELKVQKDDLFEWAKLRKQLFERPDAKVIAEMSRVMSRFVTFAAKGNSLNGADPWIIAHARIRGATVVTDENRSKGPMSDTKPPKIPDVCGALSIECLIPIDFLAAISIKL